MHAAYPRAEVRRLRIRLREAPLSHLHCKFVPCLLCLSAYVVKVFLSRCSVCSFYAPPIAWHTSLRLGQCALPFSNFKERSNFVVLRWRIDVKASQRAHPRMEQYRRYWVRGPSQVDFHPASTLFPVGLQNETIPRKCARDVVPLP